MESQPYDNWSVPPGSLPPPQARRRIPAVDNSKEAAAYRMLRQVLHNHLTTQGLTVLSALASVGRLLGHLAWHLHGLGYDLQRFSEDTLAKLGGQLLARLREGDMPLVHLPDPALTGEMPAKERLSVSSRPTRRHSAIRSGAFSRKLVKNSSSPLSGRGGLP